MNNIEKYFEGEKLQCTLGIIISVLSISLSLYFLSQQKPLLNGTAYSFLPFSVLLLAICIGIVARTPKDIKRVTEAYQTAPQNMLKDELPRMERVMNNFTIIKKVEMVLFLAGLLLAVFFWKNDLVKGIAIGLMVQCAMLYLFDYTASKRGKAYFEFLQSL